jgi:hypothetical protein
MNLMFITTICLCYDSHSCFHVSRRQAYRMARPVSWITWRVFVPSPCFIAGGCIKCQECDPFQMTYFEMICSWKCQLSIVHCYIFMYLYIYIVHIKLPEGKLQFLFMLGLASMIYTWIKQSFFLVTSGRMGQVPGGANT